MMSFALARQFSFQCPRFTKGYSWCCFKCTPHWTMCHKAAQGECYNQDSLCCDKGWHLSKSEYTKRSERSHEEQKLQKRKRCGREEAKEAKEKAHITKRQTLLCAFHCPRLSNGHHWCRFNCTKDHTMCHKAALGECANQEAPYCERGWHVSATEDHTTKRRVQTSAKRKQSVGLSEEENEDHVTKRSRSLSPRGDSETRHSMWLDLLNSCAGETKNVCRDIYFARLGLYKSLRDPEKKLPKRSEVENAYRNAIKTQMPQEESEQMLEAFEGIMREINGDDDAEESNMRTVTEEQRRVICERQWSHGDEQ